eukprot:scaffold33673_cov215-Skeletonema_dohrnii-CCMP3373.AAC.5
MLVELDEEHTKCGICIAKFSSDRDNKDPEIRKHLPVLSSSQRCDHWFCHGCVLREQLRVAEENNGRIPKWIRCMHCREKTSFNPAEPKYHRLLIDLLARAQKYAAAQLKNEEQTEVEENETIDVIPVKEEQNDEFHEDYAASDDYVTSEEKVDGEGARCVKRESDITDLGEQEVKRVKLTTPSPPLVRVNGIDTSTTNVDYTPAAPKVEDKDQLMCSVCNVAKSLDWFSKTQKSKGKKRKCMNCTGNREQFEKREANKIQQQQAKEERRLQREKKLEAEKKLADKNKAMENLEERSCVNCKVVKKEEEFYINERKKGEASVCTSCNEAEEAWIREQQRMQREEDAKKHAEVIKVAAEENAEKEASTIQKVKDAYEQYITKLEASGSTIEKEMTKQTDLLYTVTSISRRGYGFSPCLHGIYTTCHKAQEAARKTFEKLSESYRDGEFVFHETRVAKCDMTNFLIPGIEGTSRPLFEVLGSHEYYQDCTAIAINAARIGNDIQQSIPYIHGGSPSWLVHKPKSVSSAGSTSKESKVHAIFSLSPFDYEDVDVDLLGIYKDREEAMNRARIHATKCFNVDEEQINDSYTSGVTNGKLFVAYDIGSVSIETVTLDKEHGGVNGKEIELSVTDDSSLWTNPLIEWYKGLSATRWF